MANICDNTYNDPENPVKGPGVLSTPQLEYYLEKYGILKNYDKRRIKAAVYEMRLGAQAVRWEDKTPLRFHLVENAPSESADALTRLCEALPGVRGFRPADLSVSSLVLPPNSLTFVSIYEIFNLPRDLMARFNLKSAFVHKGVMLGGGPIIDPGYRSGLVTPLHNFSNIPIVLSYREPLLKVEFARTQNPDQTDFGAIRTTPLRNERDVINEEEFYANTRFVESSVYAAIEKNENTVRALSSRLKMASIAGIIGLVALITAFYNLIVNLSNVSNSAVMKLHETQEKMAAFTARNEKFLDGVDRSLDELVEELAKLKEKLGAEAVAPVERRIADIRKEINGKN